jgi:hypothetical protein
MNGSAVYGERVVIVEVQGGRVNLKTGHISSTESSHIHADNRNQTVVWGDRQFHPVTDTPEDAYERSFQVNDIHLLKEDEAQSLQDPTIVESWFGSIYQDRLVAKIRNSLKRRLSRA